MLMVNHLVGFGAISEVVPVTWNPADKGTNITLSAGNLAAEGGGGVWNSVRATRSRSTGKYYWRHAVTALGANGHATGFGDGSFPLTDLVGASGNAAGIHYQDGATFSGGIFTLVNNAGVSWTTADNLDLAIDLDAGKAWIGKNGTWTASGNPASGTNPWVTFTASSVLFPATSATTGSGTGTAAFDSTAALPSGFSPWQS